MKIYEVFDKRELMPLFLIADEQESMVEKYIDEVSTFVLDDDGIKGEISVCAVSESILEIKSLAVCPCCRKKGFGRALVNFVCEKYKNQFEIIQVGTGDSPLTVPFYKKCGFEKSHIVKNFFTDNYDRPLIENGVRLTDMIYLRKAL